MFRKEHVWFGSFVNSWICCLFRRKTRLKKTDGEVDVLVLSENELKHEHGSGYSEDDESEDNSDGVTGTNVLPSISR
jgi:hypothetical protein